MQQTLQKYGFIQALQLGGISHAPYVDIGFFTHPSYVITVNTLQGQEFIHALQLHQFFRHRHPLGIDVN
jgi:hypothetical protein